MLNRQDLFDIASAVFEFCDWAEGRVENQRPGDAQAFIQSLGYSVHRLVGDGVQVEEIPAPLTAGGAMLVASKKCGDTSVH